MKAWHGWGMVAAVLASAGVLPAQEQKLESLHPGDRAQVEGKSQRVEIRQASTNAISGFDLLRLEESGPMYLSPTTWVVGDDVSEASAHPTIEDSLVVIFRPSVTIPDGMSVFAAIFLDDVLYTISPMTAGDLPQSVVLKGLSAGQRQRLGRVLNSGIRPNDGVVISATPRKSKISTNDVVAVDVYVNGLDDLRAYQIAIDAIGGQSGSLLVHEMMIDAERSDFVFKGKQIVSASDKHRSRMLSALYTGGVNATDGAYLGSFVFQAPDGASGKFLVGIREGNDTLLRNSDGKTISYKVALPSELTVEPRTLPPPG